MKTQDDWKKEVDKLLAEKVAAAAKQFQENRSILLSELATLGGQLETLEARVKELLQEKGGLNRLINADLARANEIDRSFPRLAKQTKSARQRMDEIIRQLTMIPTGLTEGSWLNFLGVWNAKKDKNSRRV